MTDRQVLWGVQQVRGQGNNVVEEGRTKFWCEFNYDFELTASWDKKLNSLHVGQIVDLFQWRH